MSMKGAEHRPALHSENPDIRAQFFALYKRESEEYDKDFKSKYDDDLNTTLIFAGLFSAVSSAFILDVQSELRPNYNETTVALMMLLINRVDNSTFAGMDLTPPVWDGPPATAVAVQALLYSSLAATLLAAFIAMLGKQWLNRYAQGIRGSLIERSRDRQRKLDGMENWRFHVIMESLPLMLQLSVLLLGIALSRYVWTVDQTIAVVIISVTSFGLLFYTFIILSATFYYNCPFQTPLSFFFRSIIAHTRKQAPIVVQKFTDAFQKINSAFQRGKEFLSGSRAGQLFRSALEIIPSSASTSGDTEKRRWVPSFLRRQKDITPQVELPPEPLFDDKEANLSGNKSDIRCVMWMRETSTDTDVAISSMRFISEVDWHAGVDVIPSLVELANQVHEYCNLMSAYPATIPSTNEKAYAAAKAFLHLYVQRSCVNKHEIVPVKELQLGYVGLHVSQWENDLESILWMIDNSVAGHNSIVWSGFDQIMVSPSHISWMCHIIVYRAWISAREKEDVPGGLDAFLNRAFSYRPSLPLAAITDCMLIIAIMLGQSVNIQDLVVADKSKKLSTIVDLLFEQLTTAFGENALEDKLDRALNVLRVLATWQGQVRDEYIKEQASLSLCDHIIGSEVETSTKWEAARLTLQFCFRNRLSDQYYASPEGALKFLEYHLDLERTEEIHYYEPIADAFYALGTNYNIPTINFEREGFIQGICSALKVRKPMRLGYSALRFVCHIRDELLFSGSALVEQLLMEQEFSKILRSAWVELVHYGDGKQVEKQNYFRLMSNLANSRVWHRHLLVDHWETFDYATRDDQGWLSSLLRGSDAKRSYGWRAIAKWIKVAWKNSSDLDSADFDNVVAMTVNLIVMKGWVSIVELQDLIQSALQAAQSVVEEQRKSETDTVEYDVKMAVMRQIQELSNDVESQASRGWGRVVTGKKKFRRSRALRRIAQWRDHA